MPLPRDGLLTLVCAWPEIKPPEAPTDIVLPDLAVFAAGFSGAVGCRRGVLRASLPRSRVGALRWLMPHGGDNPNRSDHLFLLSTTRWPLLVDADWTIAQLAELAKSPRDAPANGDRRF